MIAELGHFALILAFVMALVQTTVPLIGAQKSNTVLMDIGKPSAIAQFFTILLAFCALTNAYITSDFSVVNVAENSHSLKPLLYKISGVWGNHEGSMVLWVLILALFGLMVAIYGKNLPPTLRARVLGIQGSIGVAFLAFIIITSNPFLRLDPAPLDGRDLNPLLQDPGLAFHPPMLYLGYVGFSITFSFAIAALIEGNIGPAWARWVRPWALLAWTSLTAGITLGSWWAYYELGWGGWWYWDPVENASFMPWLVGTAFLHSAIVVEKRDALRSWTILLAILAFTLSLMGTFLVRSGVLTSVHAFAVDPERGLFILAILGFFVGGAFILFAIRAPKMALGGFFQPISREGGLVMNNLLLSVATATVFLGTLYPLFLDAATGQKVSVGPPFFNATFIPIMIPLLLLMAIGPMLSWKQGDLASAMSRLWIAAISSGGLGILFWLLNSDKPFTPIIGFAIAGWLGGGALKELADRLLLFKIPFRNSLLRAKGLPKSAYGMTLAHLGIAIFVCGASADSAWRSEVVFNAKEKDQTQIAGFNLKLQKVDRLKGPNYETERAHILVTKDSKTVANLYPERRFYPVQQMLTTEATIYSTVMADLYATIGEGDKRNGWVLRIWYNPLIPWIWLGCSLMVLGGFISLTDRRLRIGAPEKRKGNYKTPKLGTEHG